MRHTRRLAVESRNARWHGPAANAVEDSPWRARPRRAPCLRAPASDFYTPDSASSTSPRCIRPAGAPTPLIATPAAARQKGKITKQRTSQLQFAKHNENGTPQTPHFTPSEADPAPPENQKVQNNYKSARRARSNIQHPTSRLPPTALCCLLFAVMLSPVPRPQSPVPCPPTAQRLYPTGLDRCIIAIHNAGTWTRGERV
jgi:hypothetical protein